MNIKKLPQEEKPRERLLKYGKNNVSNNELIEIILKSGTKRAGIKEISHNINGLEILPMTSYVLIKPFDTNPFQEVKIEGGIITDLGGMTPEYKSNETGEIEQEKQFIRVGTVIETGYKCEFLKPGDVVFWTIASETIVPFFRQGFVTVAENRIMAVVNEKLTERKENYGK